MASASASDNLRKLSEDILFASLYSSPPGLAEVLDFGDSPLCLLHPDEILRQNLRRREVALLVVARPNHALLREAPGPRFVLPAREPLAAGMALAEFAEKLLLDAVGQTAPLCRHEDILSGQALVTIFTAQFSPAMLSAIASRDFLQTDLDEVRELAAKDMIDPFALMILEKINL